MGAILGAYVRRGDTAQLTFQPSLDGPAQAQTKFPKRRISRAVASEAFTMNVMDMEVESPLGVTPKRFGLRGHQCCRMCLH